MAIQYFTKKILETKQFYVEPESDLGYDWNSNDRYEVIQELNYLEGGVISIENMRKALDEFEKQGANYVNVDFHCDHNEVEVTGIIYSRSTDEEVASFIKSQEEMKEVEKAKHIAKLEAEIERIKNL
jgi:hypothetical protein